MIAYYELTQALVNHLQADAEINTVVIGGFDDVDVNKQSIFGLAHILVNTAEFMRGMVRFDVTISVMDLVDERKNDIRDLPAAERWKGIDNKQDVLNTMLSVIERLDKVLRQGTIGSFDYDLIGNTSAEPFEERFENMLTGWSGSYTIEIPNTIQNC